MLTGIIVYPSRIKLVRATATSGLLAIFFAMTIQYHTNWRVEAIWYAGAVIGMPVALGALVYWLYRLAVRTPALTINENGITDSSALVGVGLIHWDEIAQIKLTTFRTVSGTLTYLAIMPRDPQRFSKRQRFPWSRLHLWLGDGAISISQLLLPSPLPTLLAQIKEYYSATIAPAITQAPIAFTAPTQPAAAA